MRRLDLEYVKDFIAKQSPETRIYLGSDSERFRINDVWHADYAVCVVIHYDGCHGCKVFGEVTTERDFDQKKNRPSMRLMTEVHKVSELFDKLRDVLEPRLDNVEIHLDISREKTNGSNCVMQEAIGYVRGTCNVIPMLKPDSPAASFCADRLKKLVG